MKTWLVLLLSICAIPAFAAEIGGRVNIKGNYDLVRVGYVGVTSSGANARNEESISNGYDNVHAVLPQSEKVASTLLSWNKGKACLFKHTRLQPGKYLLYARVGDCLLDWKAVQITPTSSSITGIELSLDPTEAGSIKLIFPDNRNYVATLEPIIEGFEQNGGTVCPMSVVVESGASGNTAMLQPVSEGTYRVSLGRGCPNHAARPRECRHHCGKQSRVKVKDGELTTVKLRD